ncbi:MAG: glycine dehydrogenase, partial [Promethearchaeota archaeon]
MDFIPHDNKTIIEMMDVIGISKVEELFQDIPKELIRERLNLEPGLSEPDLLTKLEEISKKNKIYSNSF